ncbi:uncharacterized protein K452DRAFT_237616 [Aplosporella prunicola CBS 121167]|uniref:Arf-GAP domain-containing protein n=1 Tax=Aplosporella prunicola CBS 121167 TaxID=1176127 RepID=A0A6A6AXR7_9PEZI|nr:uncharacterized protein K452DRAFT_237616 [Aplosporella prunicola CBS 121167]KAF2136396.1 hypothetical protein K452DRAFT_237616 [Aplosporella prunicola CBS 121167]
MSRRLDPRAERIAQNQQTLKSLVKLESNKSCADCKRNKHPRWASWNLGIFICIRCSGIHRGMGTHISRVKSVDLDSWTDEQLQSMLRWGNSRANKYWEAKLAPGHIPSESKIENFIRTKYDSKRWVMDGPMPDPATLDAEGDDDPLNVVKEKAQLERSASLRSGSAASASRATPPPVKKPPPQPTMDIFGDDPAPAPAPAPPSRPSTGPPVNKAPPPRTEPAAPKQSKPGDSLLGLDFFGSPASTPPSRPASVAAGTSTSAGPSRPDLKQSILSLYAAKPAAAAQPVRHQHTGSGSFGGLASGFQSPTAQGFGGLNDAFSSLSFGSTPTSATAPPPKQDAFASLASPSMSQRSTPAHTASSSRSGGFGSGGGFFDALPSKQPAPPAAQRTFSSSSGFGDWSSAASPAASAPPKPAASSGDLFDLSFDSTPSASAPPKPAATSNSLAGMSSAFNLSNPAPPKPAAPSVNYSAGMSNMDAWGSNDAWESAPPPAPAPAAPAPAPAPAAVSSPLDDDFGGWSSAPSASAGATGATPKPVGSMGGGGGNDDLFGNVWG